MLASVTALGFNRLLNMRKSTNGEGLLELPAGEQFLNHIGTVHAGAQLALAEAVSGEFLLQRLAGQVGVVPVVRRVEAKFKKPATGRVVGSVNTGMTNIDDALAVLESKGRCLLTIHVDVHDENRQHSLSATFDWFIAKSPFATERSDRNNSAIGGRSSSEPWIG